MSFASVSQRFNLVKTALQRLVKSSLTFAKHRLFEKKIVKTKFDFCKRVSCEFEASFAKIGNFTTLKRICFHTRFCRA